MVKPRVIEKEGVLGEESAEKYDVLQRGLRDRRQLSTGAIIKYDITSGVVLEIGPGPGYLGLEWLKNTTGTVLKAIELSPDMIKVATKNAEEYGLMDRVTYVLGRGQEMPFDDHSFDAVFTNGSLHEWSDPIQVFNDIHRVLRVHGRYFISDLRRNIPFITRWMLKRMVPKERIAGLLMSLNASYTGEEIKAILGHSDLKDAVIKKGFIDLEIQGEKH
jgi:ubiquinone/menaquinone biosynthesis C-methylase UbiE